MWSPSSHQTFILQSHISISRDPAQPHGLGRVPVLPRPVIARSICLVSSSGSLLCPYPLFCSSPFVKRLFVFSLMSITFPDYSHENKEPQMFQALNGPKPGCCRFTIEQAIVQTSHRCCSTTVGGEGVATRTFNYVLTFRCCSVLMGCFYCFCKDNRPLFPDMFILATVSCSCLHVGCVSPLLTIPRFCICVSSLFLCVWPFTPAEQHWNTTTYDTVLSTSVCFSWLPAGL